LDWSAHSVLSGLAQKPKTLPARIVSGSVILLSGSGMTIATNLLYNIIVARFLGPNGYGQATVVYTLLTLLSAVTLSFQIVTSKVVAQQSTPEGKAAVYRGLHRIAWACGVLVGLALLCFRVQIADYLNLPDSTLVALLAIGAAFYMPLGPRRGYIQGSFGFRALAINLVLEGGVRLGGSYLLILAGFGVRGVIAANAAAIAAAYFAVAPPLAHKVPNPLQFSYAFRETSQAIVFYSGQMLIGNCGIVLVNHFFPAKHAGLYAAVAMVGRVIFTMSSAVVNSTFPLVAGTCDEERRDLKVIATSLMLVLGSGAALALALCVAPPWVWTSLFGSGFQTGGPYSLSYLLALYAVTTVVYCLSAVIITFEMSYKIANTSWVQLAFSGVLVLGICLFHHSLREVILVQLVLMAILFVFVALPFLIDSLTDPKDLLVNGNCRPVRLIRRLSEDEVIAEFLKSDFRCSEFRDYQEALHHVVYKPDFSDAAENAKRRALLYLRHLALWKELPSDTEWFEAEVEEADLRSIRVFPRAHWRKLADGNFSIVKIAEGMQTRQHAMDPAFLAKIAAIRDLFIQEDPSFAAVLLIGVNENEPLTILDGNHRLTAALLASPSMLKRLRFVCGLSPRMTECCWYNTNIGTLLRYGRNMLTHARRNPEAELTQLLQRSESLGDQRSIA
jgi:O-antigen/teichoic acid export membrane protein